VPPAQYQHTWLDSRWGVGGRGRGLEVRFEGIGVCYPPKGLLYSPAKPSPGKTGTVRQRRIAVCAAQVPFVEAAPDPCPKVCSQHSAREITKPNSFVFPSNGTKVKHQLRTERHL